MEEISWIDWESWGVPHTLWFFSLTRDAGAHWSNEFGGAFLHPNMMAISQTLALPISTWACDQGPRCKVQRRLPLPLQFPRHWLTRLSGPRSTGSMGLWSGHLAGGLWSLWGFSKKQGTRHEGTSVFRRVWEANGHRVPICWTWPLTLPFQEGGRKFGAGEMSILWQEWVLQKWRTRKYSEWTWPISQAFFSSRLL